VKAHIERFLIENGVRGAFPQPGGGVENGGTLTLDQSVVHENQDGGIFNYGELLVSNSTVSGNSSSMTQLGGGITSSWQGNPTTRVVNSTIDGNTAAEGSAILLDRPLTGTATLSLENVTIADNVSQDLATHVLVEQSTTLSVRNSVLGDVIWRRGGTVVSAGYNVLRDVSGHGAITFGPGDQLFVDALLGPLQPNGGPTPTREPAQDSPAIDAGHPGGCTDLLGTPLMRDQRGAFRPVGEACDAGAFETASQPVSGAPVAPVAAPRVPVPTFTVGRPGRS
jgi:hypothetical protein